MLDLERQKLAALKVLIRELAADIRADLAVELWDGDVIPLAPGGPVDARIRIASSDAVRQVIRAPSLATLFSLYGSGDIDLVGISPMDAASRYDHIRMVEAARRLGKARLARALWPFLVGRSRAIADDAAFGQTEGRVFSQDRDDKAMISFHYDVSNAFYALFLDPEMVYSSAYFLTPETSLADAQLEKLDRICRKLALKPGEHILDIGCGWGALACHAARNYGVTVHGVTLSVEQHAYCQDKITRLGLEDKVRVEVADYRTIRAPEGGFDKIVQIEMFEHLGFENHDLHFETVRRMLAPRGIYLHQASARRATKDLSRFRWSSPYMNFITRYIFPGGELDHIGMTVTNLERHNFEVHDVEAMREHFALTTERWSRNLWDRRGEAEALIGRARSRMWLLYLTLFARGFHRGAVVVFQTVASKRRAGPSAMPLARADLYAGRE
jgi:cyclopropane-fatty-acyl-phospholipid synthase